MVYAACCVRVRVHGTPACLCIHAWSPSSERSRSRRVPRRSAAPVAMQRRPSATKVVSTLARLGGHRGWGERVGREVGESSPTIPTRSRLPYRAAAGPAAHGCPTGLLASASTYVGARAMYQYYCGLTSLLLRGDVRARLSGHARGPPHACAGWRLVHAARSERQRHAPGWD